MRGVTTPTPTPGDRSGRVTDALVLLGVAVVVLWAVEIVDSLALDDRLERGGILPRRVDGLDGILWAPFLHDDLAHLASNTIPFLVLGGLIALRGLREWLWVTVAVILGGGALTWLLAGSGNHLGASGLVFGWFGAVLGFAVYERRLRSFAAALVAVLLYSGIVFGVLPQDGVSWEGHLFGLVAGVLAARWLAGERAIPT